MMPVCGEANPAPKLGAKFKFLKIKFTQKFHGHIKCFFLFNCKLMVEVTATAIPFPSTTDT
jgi:hypothetical protein